METLYDDFDESGNEIGFEIRKRKQICDITFDPIFDQYYLSVYKNFKHNGYIYLKNKTYIVEPDLSKLDAWIQLNIKS